MKKIFLYLCVSLMALSLAACDNEQQAGEDRDDEVFEAEADGGKVSEDVLTVADDDIVPPPADHSRVADYAEVLRDKKAVEAAVARLDDAGVVAVVVTVSSLAGRTPGDYATELGNRWGVGDSEKNNGLVILIKPKTGDAPEEKGQVFIATGLGAETGLDNDACQRIVSEVMIPLFKVNDYDGAAIEALGAIKAHLMGGAATRAA